MTAGSDKRYLLYKISTLYYRCVSVTFKLVHVPCSKTGHSKHVNNCTVFPYSNIRWWGSLRERDHWGDQDVDGRVILGWIFGKWDVGVWTGWS